MIVSSGSKINLEFGKIRFLPATLLIFWSLPLIHTNIPIIAWILCRRKVQRFFNKYILALFRTIWLQRVESKFLVKVGLFEYSQSRVKSSKLELRFEGMMLWNILFRIVLCFAFWNLSKLWKEVKTRICEVELAYGSRILTVIIMKWCENICPNIWLDIHGFSWLTFCPIVLIKKYQWILKKIVDTS